MCGISGFYNEKIDRVSAINRMNQMMIHRGPDASGYWIDENSGWSFGHRRLAIVDLSENGAQPMMSASERFVITYNGEIYNASFIKEKLKKDGYRIAYSGSSDTEVLLEAIEKYGIDETLSMCKGMFAFALYDRKKRELFLARDRVGEKPLYYGWVSNSDKPYFAFASDISLFKQLPEFYNEIDRNALAEYMLYSYIPAPMTVYKEIYKLMPGCVLRLKTPFGDPEIYSYWSMEECARNGEEFPFDGNEQDATNKLELLMSEAISEQMVADVPIGAFLSGGIDSATIVALMQKMSMVPIKTFTIGFDDPKYNESNYANDISDVLGTDHTNLIISEKEMESVIPEMARYFTEPFGDSSMIPTYFVSKLAREKVTVSLSGDAGDELFCGYDGYWKCNSFFENTKHIPSGFKRPLTFGGGLLAGKSSSTLYKGMRCLQANNVCQLKDVVFSRKDFGSEHIVIGGEPKPLLLIKSLLKDNLSSMQLYDMLSYHPDDILVKVDRAGMAVSLENRIPMLDRDVVEFAWKIPSRYKYRDGVSKIVLRNILYKYVPKEMMERPKQGFCLPLEKWLTEGKTHEWAEELMCGNTLVRDGIIDKTMTEFCWNRFKKNQKNTKLIWNILMAEQWYRQM